MNNITAIETKYKGYRFRSRLEARWAVFFDALRLTWEYEPEGFNCNGRKYLPDFWVLVNGGIHVEIKPQSGILRADFDKMEAFCRWTELPLLVLIGTPTMKQYPIWKWAYSEEAAKAGKHGGGELVTLGHAFVDKYLPPRNHDIHPRLYWCHEDEDLEAGPLVQRAIDAARSARFEHGERP